MDFKEIYAKSREQLKVLKKTLDKIELSSKLKSKMSELKNSENLKNFKNLKLSLGLKIPPKSKQFLRENYVTLQKHLAKVPSLCKYHALNISVLILSYAVASVLAYPEFRLTAFCKEIFSLICAYAAVFIWFLDGIANPNQVKIAIGVTACIAPLLFIVNSFFSAIVVLILMMLSEFALLQYIRGCNIFSQKIPVYLVCETEHDAEAAAALSLSAHYKIFEIVVLDTAEKSPQSLSTMKSIERLRNRLQKFLRFPFFPYPRRLLYFSQNAIRENLMELQEISAQFSIPLFRIFADEFSDSNSASATILSAIHAAPISLSSLDTPTFAKQDRLNLGHALKNRRLWIAYDGRAPVLDLISALVNYSNAGDVTILCEMEKFAQDVARKLTAKFHGEAAKNYKIAREISCLQETKPDILFYGMPTAPAYFETDNLKEMVVKNVLFTEKFKKFARGIPSIFVFSDASAVDKSNLVGAVQRLGELFLQSIEKLKIIRIPATPFDELGLANKIFDAASRFGRVNLSELQPTYYRNDISPLLLKSIILGNKSRDNSVFTILPPHAPDHLVAQICASFNLKANEDISIICDNEITPAAVAESGSGLGTPLRASEELKETSVPNIFVTNSDLPKKFMDSWSVDKVNQMSTRDLISAVFQSVSEKIR